jgi:hypothetical protein
MRVSELFLITAWFVGAFAVIVLLADVLRSGQQDLRKQRESTRRMRANCRNFPGQQKKSDRDDYR